MEELKQNLLQALKHAKANEGESRNSRITKDIIRVIKVHYPDSSTARQIREVLRSTKSPVRPQATTYTDWTPGMTKKNENKQEPLEIKADVVEDNKSDDNDSEEDILDDEPQVINEEEEDPEDKLMEFISGITDKTDQEILLFFESFDGVKEFSKDQGFEINPRLGSRKYLKFFRQKASNLINADD